MGDARVYRRAKEKPRGEAGQGSRSGGKSATAFGVWSASTVAQSPRPADHTRRSSADAGKVAHQTVAETLHIELALVATPVGGFGHLPAMLSGALGFVLCAA